MKESRTLPHINTKDRCAVATCKENKSATINIWKSHELSHIQMQRTTVQWRLAKRILIHVLSSWLFRRCVVRESRQACSSAGREVCRVKITFGLLPNNWFVSTKTNSTKRFVTKHFTKHFDAAFWKVSFCFVISMKYFVNKGVYWVDAMGWLRSVGSIKF